MQGGISLEDFILSVKEELKRASAKGIKDGPLYALQTLELEASFSLEMTGKAEGGFKLIVKAGVEAQAAQTHKVKMVFSPIMKAYGLSAAAGHGGGPGGSESFFAPPDAIGGRREVGGLGAAYISLPEGIFRIQPDLEIAQPDIDVQLLQPDVPIKAGG